MHPFVILLFPLRLLAEPLMIPITGVMYGLTSQNPNSTGTYWQLFGSISKAWLLWQS